MINLIEALFLIAIAAAVVWIVASWMHRRPVARMSRVIAVVAGGLALALEIYVRFAV